MADGSGIITHHSVAGYFKEQLDTLCSQRRVSLTDGAGFYVVNLLTEFAHAERLFLPGDDATTRELMPLAELLARAVEATGEERHKLLKHLGDSSLYIGGYFQDALQAHNVDVDYYVSMGGHAYAELGGSYAGREGGTLRDIFQELAQKFERVMQLLTEMAEQHLGRDPGAMLKTYDRWLHTGDARMASRLRRAGMLGKASTVEQ